MHSYLYNEFTRARGYYLYAHGKRYVDLDLCNGKAVWGHAPYAMSTRIKNTFSQKIWGTLTTRYGKQFFKMFSHIFSYCTIQGLAFFYPSLQANRKTYSIIVDDNRVKERIRDADIDVIDILGFTYWHNVQNATSEIKKNSSTIIVWRPYCGVSFDDFYRTVSKDSRNSDIIISPLIPFAWHDIPLFLCKYSDGVYSQKNSNSTMVDSVVSKVQDDIFNMVVSTINPVILTGLSYSLVLLQKYGTVLRIPPTYIRNRRDILIIDCQSKRDSGIFTSISKHKKESKGKYKYTTVQLPLPSNVWQQQGIYISFPVATAAHYQYIREVFFEHGFYVSSQSLFLQDTKIYVYITLPAFFTKYEMSQWEKIILILQQSE